MTTDPESLFDIIESKLSAQLKISGVQYSIIIAEVTNKEILRLVNSPFVLSIENVRKPFIEFRQGGLDMTLNRVTFLRDQLPLLRGTDMSISIKENLFDTSDIDFKGRIGSLQFASDHKDMHATNMATISAGGGNSDPTAKGVAWDAVISSSDFANLLPDPETYFIQENISVQNHAYGTGIENYYGIESVAYDDITYKLPWLIHIFSSGNVGDQAAPDGMYAGLPGRANLTGQFKQSKNTISVGATDSFNVVVPMSSGGPAYDGRIKPEIVAYGHGGSSGSAAVVSGISLLIQELYLKMLGELPPSSLVKASLINSAHDINNVGLDYKSGFGAVNAYKAVQSIIENRFSINEIIHSQTISIPINIPSNIAAASFTISWLDPPANVLAAKGLVNDIDIEIENKFSGERFYPWLLSSFPHLDSLSRPAVKGIDTLNTVEKITIDFPEVGEYIIHIKGSDIKTGIQAVSLVWQFEQNNNFQWVFPTKNDHLIPGEKNLIRWDAPKHETGQLEYRFIGGDWVSLENVNTSSGYYSWHSPEYYGLAQLKWNESDTSIISDPFVIAKPLEPKVALLCDDSLVINWNDPGNADRFELFRIGSKHLEHYSFTDDTFYVEDAPDVQNRYYAVAPFYDDVRGPLSYSFDFTKQGGGCFLEFFYLRHVLNGKAFFTAELSGIEEIDFVILEEKLNGAFMAIRMLDDVDTATVFFESNQLNQGVNDFRLKIILNDGKEIISETERVYYTGGHNVLLFPNPVASGGEISLLAKDLDEFELKILDVQGKEILHFTELESPVSIPLFNLVPGIYIYKIVATEGDLHGKIQVY